LRCGNWVAFFTNWVILVSQGAILLDGTTRPCRHLDGSTRLVPLSTAPPHNPEPQGV
jgi:hypothetical protein